MTAVQTVAQVPRPAGRHRAEPTSRWLPLARACVGPLLAVLSAVVWFNGLRPIAPTQISSVGLIAELTPTLLLSYPILVAAVLVELTSARPRQRLLAAYTALGVLLVYGLQPASEQVARLSVSWLHMGFAGYIADHGQVLPGYDARFSWPGFFSLVAFVTRASGQSDVTPLLQWTPAVLALLGALGMRALAIAVFGPGNRAWIATWLFLLTQWTEQDYFSPQGLTYVMLLGGLALVLRFLVRPGLSSAAPSVGEGRLVPLGSPRDRLIVQAMVVGIALALAPTHQLTPFIFGGFLLLLSWSGRLWSTWLPWMVLVAAVMWFCLGAKDFWSGQLNMVIGDIGNVSSAVGQGIGERFVGDAGRTLILGVRVGLTCVVALLAGAGWSVLRRRGMRSWALPLLAIAPFGLIAVQSYGGEVFLRCYLFSLPFAVLLAAVAVEDLLSRPMDCGWWLRRRTLAVTAALVLLTGLGLTTVTVRGGNDAYTSFTGTDVAAVNDAYARALHGQTVDALTDSVPLNFRRVGDITQETLEGQCHEPAMMTECVLDRSPDYLIVTPSQDNGGRIYDNLPVGWTGQLVTRLVTSGQYRVVFDEGGSKVLMSQNMRIPPASRPH